MTTIQDLEQTQAQYQDQIAKTQQQLEQLIKESIFMQGRIAQMKQCEQEHEQTKEEESNGDS